MRILHTSDWHLGINFSGADALKDQEYFLNQIYDIVVRENINAVIVAGDIYDRSIAPADAISLYDSAMTKLCAELSVPVLIVAGNHDSPDRLASCRDLLKKSGLYVKGYLTREITREVIGDTEFFLLPWFTAEKVRSLYPEEADYISTVQDAYETVCARLREAFTPGLRHIAVAHAYIVNAELSGSDKIAEVGFASAVSGEVFRGFDYVALGHLHGPQDIGDNIRYSGTPMCYSFGREEEQEKSVTVIDTADMHREILPLVPLHDRMTVRGTLSEVLSRDYTFREREAYVRAEITDVYLGLDTISRLRERFPNLLEPVGKQFDAENGTITMTIEDLKSRANDPQAIFTDYFRDILKTDPDEHVLDLFRQALEAYGKEEQK